MKNWTSKEIKQLRKDHSISQRVLSELLGVAENYIYYLERGVREPSKSLRLLLDCVEEKLIEKLKKERRVKRDNRGF
jgi:DNA-binding transcriptional regulator YiaG